MVETAYGAPIFVRNNGEYETLKPIPLNAKASGTKIDETWLQDLIDRHPECLPIQQIEPLFATPISICREMPVPRGKIDNFLMTPEGNLIIVETKLWRNPESRREVVAQTLDYASSIFEMDYSELQKRAFSGKLRDGNNVTRLHDLGSGPINFLAELAAS